MCGVFFITMVTDSPDVWANQNANFDDNQHSRTDVFMIIEFAIIYWCIWLRISDLVKVLTQLKVYTFHKRGTQEIILLYMNWIMISNKTSIFLLYIKCIEYIYKQVCSRHKLKFRFVFKLSVIKCNNAMSCFILLH